MSRIKRFIKNIVDNLSFQVMLTLTLLGGWLVIIGIVYLIGSIIAEIAHLTLGFSMFLTMVGFVAGAVIYYIIKAILWVKHMWEIS